VVCLWIVHARTEINIFYFEGCYDYHHTHTHTHTIYTHSPFSVIVCTQTTLVRVRIDEKKGKRKVISLFLICLSYTNSNSSSKAGRVRSVVISLHVIWIRYLQFAWCHYDSMYIFIYVSERERNPFDASYCKNKCSIIVLMQKIERREEDTRIGAQTDPPLTCIPSRSEKERERERRAKHRCERFILIVLFTPTLSMHRSDY